MKRTFEVVLAIAALIGLTSCSPEIGSEAWCKKMDGKPKGDWTANELGDYTKHCIIRTGK